MSEPEPVFKLPNAIPSRSASRAILSSENEKMLSPAARQELSDGNGFLSPDCNDGSGRASSNKGKYVASRRRRHMSAHYDRPGLEANSRVGFSAAGGDIPSASGRPLDLLRPPPVKRSAVGTQPKKTETEGPQSYSHIARPRRCAGYHPLIKKQSVIPAALQEYNIQQSLASSHDRAAALQLHARQRAARRSLQASNVTSLDYSIPEWSDDPPDGFKVEMIKSGVSQLTVLCSKSYVVVGRLAGCKVRMDHPSVSRFHAVLQYCKGTEEMATGFYLYDLGSTHGTFLNKERLKEKTYYRLKDGYVMKFGLSTRLFVFHAPEVMELPSSIYSVPKDADSQKSPCEAAASSAAAAAATAACDWGMGEDAEEVLMENPFALPATNEDFYVNNPAKVLQDWFEREGHELEYTFAEKGSKHSSCSVRLPINNPDGEFLVVKVPVEGKKKETIAKCALEACKVLDSHNLLQQSQHESQKSKKEKWEQEDFYDSDEDPYLDQTGTLEKKREWRKKITKNAPVENHASLVKKLSAIDEQIKQIKAKLDCSIQKSGERVQEDMDPLDAYMLQLEDPKNISLDPVTRSKLHNELAELEKKKKMYEEMKAAVASSLPAPVNETAPAPSEVANQQCSGLHHEISETVTSGELQSFSEKPMESESFEAPESCQLQSDPVLQTVNEISDKHLSGDGIMVGLKEELPANTVAAPAEISGADLCLNEADYSMWLPPVNQSGDGSTHLNQKYGY